MKTKLVKILLITLVLIGLLLANFPLNLAKNQIQAEEITKEPSFPREPSISGRIEGTGTYFEIKDSQYLNITLRSEKEIKVVFESIPRMISIDISSSTDATFSNLTLSGLEPNKTYFKYQDSYKNEITFVSNENGTFSWSQDLSQPHHIWIQEEKGTIFLPEQCSTYGSWNEETSTCILTQDLTEGVEITTNEITLDCANHKITGTFYSYGIFLYKKSGVNIKNCNISGFSYGILLIGSRYNTLEQNNISSALGGIYLAVSSSNNNLLANDSSNNSYGIILYSSPNNRLRNNSIKKNKYNFGVLGLQLSEYLQDIDQSNTINGNQFTI